MVDRTSLRNTRQRALRTSFSPEPGTDTRGTVQGSGLVIPKVTFDMKYNKIFTKMSFYYLYFYQALQNM